MRGWQLGALVFVLGLGLGLSRVAWPAPPLGAAASDGAEDDDTVGRRVQELLHAHANDIFTCVSDERHAPSGELLMRLIVDERGRAARAEVLKSDIGSTTLNDCLTQKARGWDLTPLGASAGDQVVFPLAFHPDPQAADAPVQGSEVRRTISGGPSPRETEAHLIVRRFELRAGQTMLLPGPGAALFVVDGALRLVGAPGVDDVALGTHDVAYFAGPAAGSGRAEAEGITRILEITAVPSAPPPPLKNGVKVVRAASAPRAASPGGETAQLLDDPAPFSLALVQAAGGAVERARHAAVDEYLYVLAGRIHVAPSNSARPAPLHPGELARLARNQPHTLRFSHALYVELHTPPLAAADRHVLTTQPPPPEAQP